MRLLTLCYGGVAFSIFFGVSLRVGFVSGYCRPKTSIQVQRLADDGLRTTGA